MQQRQHFRETTAGATEVVYGANKAGTTPPPV